MVEYRTNPVPNQAYRLIMRIDDAPGEFGWIQGFMQFDVTNTTCLLPPKDNPGGYSSPVPTRSIPFTLQRQANGEYTGTAFTDGMIDEDYYGYGVCRWELVNVQVQLKATGAKTETLYMADLYGDELKSRTTKVLYYAADGYPRHPESILDEPDDSGQPDRSRMASFLTDDDLFKITLLAKEMAP